MVYVSAYSDLNPQDYRLPWSEHLNINNKDSEVLAVSSSWAKRIGYRNPVDVLGKTAYDLSCPAAELAADFIAQDRLAVIKQEEKMYLTLAMHSFSDIKPYVYTRKAVGSYIVTNHKKLESGVFAKHFYEKVVAIDCRFYPRMQTCYEVVQVFKGLTRRETDVMYYLILGMNSNMISEKLSLSKRTIQHYIENTKDKMGCTTTRQLVELALYMGFNKQVPLRLLC